jgi:Mg-chelatase subunit ChlD
MTCPFDLTRVVRSQRPQDNHRTKLATAHETSLTMTSVERDRTQVASLVYDATVAAPASGRPSTHTWFLFDISSSMGGAYDGAANKIEGAKRAATTFIVESSSRPGDAAGIIAFNAYATVHAPMSVLPEGRPVLLRSLRTLRPEGSTDLRAAIECAERELRAIATGADGQIIVLTDGHSSDPSVCAERVKATGVRIHCVGIGERPSDVDEAVLRRVASVIDGVTQYTFAKDMAMLNATLTAISAKTRVRSL